MITYTIDKTFPLRLYHFVANTTVNDCMSEEEKWYLINVARRCMNQLLEQAKTDAEVAEYCKNCIHMISTMQHEYESPLL